MASDLEIALGALSGKQSPYKRLWDYYDGNPPLVYSAERLREVFRNANAQFSQNWCAVVVDTVLERIQLQRLVVNQGQDTALSARLMALMEGTELLADSSDAHLAALVTGESAIIAWRGEQGIEAYYNDPRMVHVQYDSARPRIKAWAAKWWIGDDGACLLNLYYPDRLEHYRAEKKDSTYPSTANAFQPSSDIELNPWGIVPVFHLRRERRGIISELKNIIAPQSAIDKLLSDMMVAAEFGAYRQRWVITQSDISKLKNAPNEIWEVPAGDGVGQGTQVGEFSTTDLGNYMETIDKLANAVAVISRTPKHYFWAQGTPSGEALIMQEAPLNKKAARYIGCFSPTWQQIASFLLLLDGTNVPASLITPLFARPETVAPLTQGDIRQRAVAAGIPLETWLRREEGWGDDDIAALELARAEEAARQQVSLAQVTLNAMRGFDQGNANG